MGRVQHVEDKRQGSEVVVKGHRHHPHSDS